MPVTRVGETLMEAEETAGLAQEAPDAWCCSVRRSGAEGVARDGDAGPLGQGHTRQRLTPYGNPGDPQVLERSQ
jgi:hypothetical protein